MNWRGFDKATQYFCDAPGLGDAAARREWRFGVKDFADRADAGLSEMRLEAVEEMPRRRAIIGVGPSPAPVQMDAQFPVLWLAVRRLPAARHV